MRANEFVDEEINPDVQQMGFHHKQKIGDFFYTATTEVEPYHKTPMLIIRALDGKIVVGKAKFYITHGDTLTAALTTVQPQYQQQGIASTMYAYAKMLGNDIEPSKNQLAMGKKMWKSWKKSGGAKHLMKDVAEDADGNIEIRSEPTSTGGVQVYAYRDGKEVGWVRFQKAGNGKVKATMVHVPERLRRQGIGSAMYKHARHDLGLDIVPSDSQTADGKLFWNKIHETPDVDEGWKEKAAAGAMALGALGATGDAAAKEKETWIQPRKPAVTAMAPAAKFDATKTLAKAPVAKAPVAKAPVAKAPVAKAPVAIAPAAMNILSFNNPESEEVLHRTAAAAGLKGTELAQFMAQTRHESADFSRMKEFGGDKYFNKLYDPKTSPRTAKILGNTQIGDGIRYHGRGFIQITGRDNYRMAGDALGLPLEKHPDLASKPSIAAKIAVWYWKTRVKPYITNFADTASVTKKINPAMRGLQDRHSYFQDYQKII